MTMSLKNLSQFYTVIQTVEIDVVRVKGREEKLIRFDLYYQNIINFNYTSKRLRELVLVDILALPKDQIQYNVNRLNSILTRFIEFSSLINAKFYDDVTDEDLFKWLNRAILEQFLISIPFDKFNRIKHYAKYDLLESLWGFHNMMQSKSLAVINQIYNITGLKSKDFRLEEVNQKVENIQEQSTKINPFVSYGWLGKPEIDIRQLYYLLDQNYIVDTSLENFIAVFSGVKVELFQPVKWSSSNATELLYFIKTLMSHGLVDNDGKRMNYRRLKACFVKADGAPFNEDFKSLNQKLELEMSQNKKDNLDAIAKVFI